jgi:O-antigen/teichoic acid export membrane protein
MLAAEQETIPLTEGTHRARFFRQSGWLMIANIAGGVLMWAVHLLARATGKNEYGVFITLLTAVMLVPAIPLQMMFAQQTAKAIATGRERELSALARSICVGLFVAWALVCVGVFAFQGAILRVWDVDKPEALWVTLPILLMTLWAPVFLEMLQGEENFLWLGWSMMCNGIGRLAVAAFAVLVLHAGAVGMMVGVLIGTLAAVVIAIWQTKRLWALPTLAFDWSSMLRQIIPLMFGFLFVQFLFTGDTLFVKHYFTAGATGAYGSAGTLSRALI